MDLIRSRSVWVLLLAASLCWNPAASQDSNDSATSPQLVAATNRFGFALLRQLQRQDRDGNIFYSPLSMMQALSMAYNGARGDTEREMRRALGFEKLSLDELNRSSAMLLEELMREDAGLKLSIANSLWARQGVPFNPDFLVRNQQSYGADISILDFANPGSPAVINDWVARRTNGRIPTIIDKLEDDDALVLINAVYFKAAWAYEFDPSRTSSDVFYGPGGRQDPVPMMNRTDSMGCFAGDGVRAVSLPYRTSGAHMELFLPEGKASIAELLQRFDHDAYRRWKRSFQPGLVTLKLPRMELQYRTDLKPSLRALGMRLAFTDGADFSGMTAAEQLFISKVGHKATLEVDEEGTEATAVTDVYVRLVSGRRLKPFKFIANRPFVVVIADDKTDSILFMGVVTNPQSSTTQQ